MLTVVWGVDGFHAVDQMTSQCSFNSEYFVSHVLAPMTAKIFPQKRIPYTRQLQLQLDKRRVHFSKATEQFITENHIVRVFHPPYSPDIAPSGFRLFGHVTTLLVGQTFDETK
jgi:hypothetical protein